MYPFWHILAKYIKKFDFEIKTKLNSNEKYIFTPNHPDKLDPFIIFYSLSLKELKKILPIRFMTAKKYMNNPVSNLVMSLMGCYIIDNKVLDESVKFLKENNNLCIFIQGRVDKTFKHKPKVGAAYIQKEFKESYMVPIRVNESKKKIIFIDKIKPIKYSENLQYSTDKLLTQIKNEK
jgi:1-acyl-sn-glycerol-3-phosphate acyltransferase